MRSFFNRLLVVGRVAVSVVKFATKLFVVGVPIYLITVVLSPLEYIITGDIKCLNAIDNYISSSMITLRVELSNIFSE